MAQMEGDSELYLVCNGLVRGALVCAIAEGLQRGAQQKRVSLTPGEEDLECDYINRQSV